jgi:pSer/pThr/pTyr-binding forkhead associated (FHA) protein
LYPARGVPSRGEGLLFVARFMPNSAGITLRVIDGADRGRVFQNLAPPISIGREEGNTIQLNDERVSRFHLKIQEDHHRVVLTDLESTNGTRVNGEDVQLRILRHGDLIHVGRSVLLFGSRDEIAERLMRLREQEVDAGVTLDPASAASLQNVSSLDFEILAGDEAELQATLHALEPPELPERLTPVQAAQLAELLEFIHIRLRNLLSSVKIEATADKVPLDTRQWQSLVDLQARLSTYLRDIGNP